METGILILIAIALFIPPSHNHCAASYCSNPTLAPSCPNTLHSLFSLTLPVPIYPLQTEYHKPPGYDRARGKEVRIHRLYCILPFTSDTSDSHRSLPTFSPPSLSCSLPPQWHYQFRQRYPFVFQTTDRTPSTLFLLVIYSLSLCVCVCVCVWLGGSQEHRAVYHGRSLHIRALDSQNL